MYEHLNLRRLMPRSAPSSAPHEHVYFQCGGRTVGLRVDAEAVAASPTAAHWRGALQRCFPHLASVEGLCVEDLLIPLSTFALDPTAFRDSVLTIVTFGDDRDFAPAGSF